MRRYRSEKHFLYNHKEREKSDGDNFDREQALNTMKVNNRILITRATVLPEKDKCTLLSLGENRIDYILYPSRAGWKQQTIEVDPVSVVADWKKVGARRMTVHIDQPFLCRKSTSTSYAFSMWEM